eukprot:15480101-Alexandrium_andersonii.AAC.1
MHVHGRTLAIALASAIATQPAEEEERNSGGSILLLTGRLCLRLNRLWRHQRTQAADFPAQISKGLFQRR